VTTVGTFYEFINFDFVLWSNNTGCNQVKPVFEGASLMYCFTLACRHSMMNNNETILHMETAYFDYSEGERAISLNSKFEYPPAKVL
jgi:hypothetical protein